MEIKKYIKKSYDRKLNFILETIFTKKNMQGRVRPRNLLNHIEKFSYARLGRETSTDEIFSPNQEIFYVVNGDGEIILRNKKEEIKKDYAFLIPAGIPYIFLNSSKRQSLEMLVISEEAPKQPNKEIVVKDTNKIQFDREQYHWCHKVQTIFDFEKTNLSKLHYVSLVHIDSGKMPEPHSHPIGTDEVWYALEGITHMALNDNIFKHTPGTSVYIPDDGKTFHTSINTSNKAAKFFFFLHHADLEN